jgi:hypothetical protein
MKSLSNDLTKAALKKAALMEAFRKASAPKCK